MRARSFLLVALLSSLGLFACGGTTVHAQAKTEEDPWKDFKGTYGTSAEPRVSKADKTESRKSDTHGKAKAETETREPAAAAAPPAAPPTAKKPSKTTLRGESLSSIGVETLADVAKGAFKAKLVASKVTVGAQYEQVQVTLKGTTVQIFRPAASPDSNGPSVSAPKAKNAALAKNESGWYDEEADVLLVVSAAKKASSQKALGALLSR